MAQKTRIKILTSGNTGVPLSSGNRILRQGEMAYSFAAHGSVTGGDRLYIGTGAEDGSGIATKGTFKNDNSANVVAPALVIQISDCKMYFTKLLS